MMKRSFDVLASAVGLMLLAPLFLVIALVVKMSSKGPVFFRQVRVGQYGKTFRIHKFRTMVFNAESTGAQITSGKDTRITHPGHFLRKYKLDELPQLIDVLVGNMSLVGPRPEVSRYVECYPEQVRDLILSVKPGITDPASIEFRSESEILGHYHDPDRAYIEEILPIKLRHYVDYVNFQSFIGDIQIIFKTLRVIFKLDQA